MNKEFINAIDDLVREKGISKDVLIEAIESALVSAYKKNYGTAQNVRVNIDREEGDVDVLMRTHSNNRMLCCLRNTLSLNQPYLSLR